MCGVVCARTAECVVCEVCADGEKEFWAREDGETDGSIACWWVGWQTGKVIPRAVGPVSEVKVGIRVGWANVCMEWMGAVIYNVVSNEGCK